MSACSHTEDDFAVLALSTTLPDGSILTRSWAITESSAARVAARLGEPNMETIATADAARETDTAVRNHPGYVHMRTTDAGGAGV